MSHARPADLQIPNLIRAKTDCTLSHATLAVLDEVLLLSRQVSLPKSARDGDSRVKWCLVVGHGIMVVSLRKGGGSI
jgi:hypothetical protein